MISVVRSSCETSILMKNTFPLLFKPHRMHNRHILAVAGRSRNFSELATEELIRVDRSQTKYRRTFSTNRRKSATKTTFNEQKQREKGKKNKSHFISSGEFVSRGDHQFQDFPPYHLDVFISCLAGLETILSTELKNLNIAHKVSLHGVWLINPTIESIMACHLYLGTASNILLRCGIPFSARGLAELRRKTSKLPWKQILKRDIRLEARATSAKSKLYHTAAIQERVIAGIYDALGYDLPDPLEGAVAIPEEIRKINDDDTSLVKLDIRILRDQVEIFLKTSQTPLHQRGYRLQTAKAPLREDLAFAMLWASGWTTLYSGYQQSEEAGVLKRSFGTMLDPFCGSGTIAIEAASIAAGLPPGRLRSAPFIGTCLESNQKWLSLIQKSIPLEQPESNRKIICASDRDQGAVSITSANADRAGVLEFMDLRQSSLSSNPLLETPGRIHDEPLLIATNPPFGKRISPTRSKGKDFKLLPLYQTLGHRIQRLVDNGNIVGATILTNNPNLLGSTGLPLKSLLKSTHGGMTVNFMFFKTS